MSIELNSRFAALDNLEDETDQNSVECSWNTIKKSYADAVKKAVGFKKRRPRNVYQLKHGTEYGIRRPAGSLLET